MKALALVLAILALAASVGTWRGQDRSVLRSLVDVEVTSVFMIPLPEGDTLFFNRVDSAFVRFDYCADSVQEVRRQKGVCVGRDGEVQSVFPYAVEQMEGAVLSQMITKHLAQQKRHAQTLHKHLLELDYYARTHGAVDGGYNEVMLFAQQHRERSQHADSALVLVERVAKMFSTLPAENRPIAVRRTTFKVNGVPVRMDSQRGGLISLMPQEAGDTIRRRNMLALHHILFPALADHTKVFNDSLGRHYSLTPVDTVGDGRVSLYRGVSYDSDGSYYHGDFNLDYQREGTGFAVDADLVKYGMWKGDVFQGEQMLYTPDRVYGIDISRYQHELKKAVSRRVVVKGKRGKQVVKTVRTKTVGIDWANLRIRHLGPKAKSHVQGTVDYPVSFVFIKCTQGTTIRSNYYASDLAAARRHAIPAAPYHFFSHKSSGAAQASFFLKNARLGQTTMPPMLDVEPTAAQIAAMGGPNGMFREMLAWLRAVEKAGGRRPIIYVSQTFVNKYMKQAPAELLKYDVWIARYGEYRPYVKLQFWQLTPFGRVDGIEGDVDINVFNGSREDFEKWLEK